jgi:hypothetical protein
MSNSEAQNLMSKGVNAVFIPHGFNAPVFEKKTLTKYCFDASKLNVCLLGYNYRDFDMFENAVMKMAESRPDIVFHAVGQRAEEKKRFEKYKNVIIYPYIDDDEYYSLIQACDYNFLPVTFATANNVVMEAFKNKIAVVESVRGTMSEDAKSTLANVLNNTSNALNDLRTIRAVKNESLVDGVPASQYNSIDWFPEHSIDMVSAIYASQIIDDIVFKIEPAEHRITFFAEYIFIFRLARDWLATHNKRPALRQHIRTLCCVRDIEEAEIIRALNSKTALFIQYRKIT